MSIPKNWKLVVGTEDNTQREFNALGHLLVRHLETEAIS